MTKQEKFANYEMMKNECFETRKLNDSLGKLIVVKNKKIKELEQKLEQTEKDLADYQFNYPTIKELQNENAELKSIAENQQSSNMSKYFENKKLKEGLAVGSTLNKGLNSMNKALEEERDKYRNMVFDKDEQLTKAKEIIKKMKYLLFDVWGYIDISFEKNVNKFLSEVDK